MTDMDRQCRPLSRFGNRHLLNDFPYQLRFRVDDLHVTFRKALLPALILELGLPAVKFQPECTWKEKAEITAPDGSGRIDGTLGTGR